jgi:hypothetical protein
MMVIKPITRRPAMHSWISWIVTGLLLALGILSALLLIALARLGPRFIRWIAQSALAAALLYAVSRMVYRSMSRESPA